MTNTLSSSGGAAAALVFESTTFDVVTRNDQPWIGVHQLGVALGYKRSDIIAKLFRANAAEFTDSMTALVKLPTAGGEQETRIFSLRGAHLLAMFARTAIAALFRKWVLDILDAQLQAPRIAYTAGPNDTLSAMQAALDAANAVAAQVQRDVSKAVLAGGDGWKHKRYLLSFVTDSKIGAPPLLEVLAEDALVVTPDELPDAILHSLRMLTEKQVQKIAMGANLRMMGNMGMRQETTDFTALIKTVQNLGGHDLYEVMKQGHMELSLRNTGSPGDKNLLTGKRPSVY